MTVESIALFWNILETPSLSEEASTVVRNILKAKSLENFAKPGWDRDRDGVEAEKMESTEVRDLRIRSLTFHDFRSFPFYEELPFGIDFVGREGEPSSLFLLGSNGTGKSSIYTALEFYYTGQASLADERKVNRNKYLTFGFKEDEAYDIKKYIDVELADSKIVPIAGEISAPSAFCSLFDVQLLERTKVGLTDFIFNQLGYGDVIEIDDFLQSESRRIEKRMDDLDDAKESLELSSSDLHLVIEEFVGVVFDKNILNLDEERKFVNEDAIRDHLRNQSTRFNWELQNRMFASEWKRIEEEPETKTAGIDLAEVQAGLVIGDVDILGNRNEKQIRRLANLFGEFFRYYDDQDTMIKPYSVLDKLYERYAIAKSQENKLLSPEETSKEKTRLEKKLHIISEVKSQIRNKKEDIAHEFVNDFKSFIKNILQYFSYENEEFDLDIGENGICDVLIRVKPEGAEPFETTPKEYFNSFRFVLYCVALKIALALNQMKKNKFSVPIVIDDVFDASDFENSLELEEFVYHIFRSYQNSVRDEGVNIPLQIILLTHDEMMKSAFERGLERILMEDEKTDNHYICGRLIPYKYAKNDSKEELIQLRETNFYNLYIPL